MDDPAGAPTSTFRRVLFWSPVGICLLLFCQVSFLGLRPALCEGRRLEEARAALERRHARDLALRDTVAESLRARSDPIFRERQRRLRVLGPAPSEP